MESIHDAASRGEVEQVARLLDCDLGRLESRDARGWCPIHIAAECGNASVVRLLVERGADVDAITDDGFDYTALNLAAGNGSAELVQFLLSTGARMDIRDDYEHTPIHTAAIFGRPQALEVLLRAGANVNDRVKGWTPMTYAHANAHGTKSRPRFSKCVPSATEEEYEAVVRILRDHGGII